MSRYKTETHNGITWRIKCWNETFIDECTGEPFKIKRQMPVKRDGKRCNQFGTFNKVVSR